MIKTEQSQFRKPTTATIKKALRKNEHRRTREITMSCIWHALWRFLLSTVGMQIESYTLRCRSNRSTRHPLFEMLILLLPVTVSLTSI